MLCRIANPTLSAETAPSSYFLISSFHSTFIEGKVCIISNGNIHTSSIITSQNLHFGLVRSSCQLFRTNDPLSWR